MHISATFDPHQLVARMAAHCDVSPALIQSSLAQGLGYDSWAHLMQTCEARRGRFQDAAIDTLYCSAQDRAERLRSKIVPGSHFIPTLVAPAQLVISRMVDELTANYSTQMTALLPWGVSEVVTAELSHKQWTGQTFFAASRLVTYHTRIRAEEPLQRVEKEMQCRVKYNPSSARGIITLGLDSCPDLLESEFRIEGEDYLLCASPERRAGLRENLQILQSKLQQLEKMGSDTNAVAKLEGTVTCELNIDLQSAFALVNMAITATFKKTGLPLPLAIYGVPDLPRFLTVFDSQGHCEFVSLFEFARWACVQDDCIEMRVNRQDLGMLQNLQIAIQPCQQS